MIIHKTIIIFAFISSSIEHMYNMKLAINYVGSYINRGRNIEEIWGPTTYKSLLYEHYAICISVFCFMICWNFKVQLIAALEQMMQISLQ